MSDRCSGHCCRVFFLPRTPAELHAWRDGTTTVNGSTAEAEFIADMVIPLYESKAGDPSPITKKPQPQDAWYYTCRHRLPNGNCGVYEARPSLCRDYPYGGPCEYPGCTWASATEATRRHPPDVRAKDEVAA